MEFNAPHLESHTGLIILKPFPSPYLPHTQLLLSCFHQIVSALALEQNQGKNDLYNPALPSLLLYLTDKTLPLFYGDQQIKMENKPEAQPFSKGREN